MSKLNKDILFLIFNELQNDSRDLFSCLMVNKYWCETVIPILWKNPWRFNIDYHKSSLYSIVVSYLPDNMKGFLAKEGIHISDKSLAIDYLSFCKSINMNVIDDIISTESSPGYYRSLLQEELYNTLMKKCPGIKYLDIRSDYQIFCLPCILESKPRLESLCELACNTSTDPNYFYRLARICQRIQKIIIINKNAKANHGITILIEAQKNLKYFKWIDHFNEEYCLEIFEGFNKDPYTESFYALRKHADTLNHIEISIQHDRISNYYDIYDNQNYIFLQYTLLELHKLKTLKVSSPVFLNSEGFEEKLETVAYPDLEILEKNVIDIYQATCIIKNSVYLKELWIYKYRFDCDRFSDDSLNFIRTIRENCELIEYLTIPVFPLSDNHLAEFELLLKKCQNLRSLAFRDSRCRENRRKEIEYGIDLSNVIIRSAPFSLKEIEFSYDIWFSSKTLRTFFEMWKGRPAISIQTCVHFYRSNYLVKLIDEYKISGVIKDFTILNSSYAFYGDLHQVPFSGSDFYI
ncbi:hypothetical protein C1646_679807 [Rhizophagus diaphanus]|nr:hypothetical protein C1646_679807 [Rhizophagus diaphanus] [Rhizophagus sp. MUCL 43196]